VDGATKRERACYVRGTKPGRFDDELRSGARDRGVPEHRTTAKKGHRLHWRGLWRFDSSDGMIAGVASTVSTSVGVTVRKYVMQIVVARIAAVLGFGCACSSQGLGADEDTRSCLSDDGCAEGEFCDRGRCSPSGDVAYGVECYGPPLISHLGIPLTIADSCSALLCLDSRCRSCVSGKECYETVGLHSCYPKNAFGNRCGNTPPAGYDIYEPEPVAPRIGNDVVPTAGACPSDRVVLSLSGLPRESVLPLRLAAVWWHQRAGEPDEFARIAYDVELATDDNVVISMAEVGLPSYENLICWRGCPDRSICSCVAEPQFALASIVLAIDEDRSGALSMEELRREQVGIADVFLGWSPLRTASVSTRWGGVRGPIEAGFCAYPATPQLSAITDEATSFAMNTCPAGDRECEVPVSRKFCHRDCDRDWGLNRLGL
jgi:hypothetical protein